PTPHAQGGRYPERPCRAHVVELRRAELDERRDEQRIGPLVSNELVDAVLPRHRLLDSFEYARQHAAERQPCEREYRDRGPLVRALANSRRRLVTRIGIAQVVQADAKDVRDAAIAPPPQDRRETDGHLRWKARGEAIDELAAAEGLLTVGREVHVMSPLGERRDHRLEVPEVGEVPRDEQNLHAGESTRPVADG